MSSKIETAKIENFLGKRVDGTKSRLPARLDYYQSATGLILALFMWGHMALVSTALISEELFDSLASFFELEWLLGKGYPIIDSMIVFVLFIVFFTHAMLALRKFPISYRQWQIAREHSKLINHQDTNLWLVQIVTGFVMFFLGSIHLGIMCFMPETMNVEGAHNRIVEHNMWIFYVLLLVSVEFHALIGLYRLCVKWGWFDGVNVAQSRERRKTLKTAMWVLIVFFLTLGCINIIHHFF
ncbi:fumarate reductase cytochrome b subunit [Campylobacter sp. MG1]|uniref:fumarate reductase cytochrome b subunit n=1 Tax=Campylobacter sp. MG1 TaxID=2976332 RepID=UPI00226C7F76|nr:fumarate reductase cytochrome b subunit [Campylobacter sp. MG1]